MDKEHCITLNAANYRDRLLNIVSILRYVKQIKPNIDEFVIKFDQIFNVSKEFLPYIQDAFTCGIIPFAKLFISLKNCCKYTEEAILAHCPSKTRVRMSTKNIHYIFTYDIIFDRLWLDVHAFGTSFIMKNKQICEARHLGLRVLTESLDLQNLDITKNNALQLAIHQDFHCKDPYKITCIVDRNGGDLWKFSTSCLEDRNFKTKSRLEKVNILDNTLEVYRFWCSFAKILPRNVLYVICAKDSGALLLIDELKKAGVQKIKYLCGRRCDHLNAMMCRFLSNDHMYDIEKVCNYEGDELSSVEQVYEEMDVATKQTWHMLVKQYKVHKASLS
jgi:hypothetical protein